MLSDFRSFLIKQNVMALAIAVVIGTALGALVKALVDDIIMPIVAAATPASEWKSMTIDVGSVRFLVGDFLSVLVNFVIIGLVAWRLSRLFDKPVADAPIQICAACRLAIDAAATRCPHCTSSLPAALPALR